MHMVQYSPFTTIEGAKEDIYTISYNSLTQLHEKDIEEGYQIEYKRELSRSVKDKLPAIITSFANDSGGWLFIGIDEKKKTITSIPRKDYELDINNTLKDVTSPVPKIYTRFLTDSDDSEQGVLVIWVPEGSDPPYISQGKTYQRFGSGSSPLKEVTDRYHLDKLYLKAKQKRENIETFCIKEISVFNREWISLGNRYSNFGMCNVYIIPNYNLDLHNKKPENLAEYLFDESKKKRTLRHEGLEIMSEMTFEKYSYSLDSIIFRNQWTLDYFEKSIAWEQFYDGKAKFHIPIPYFEKNIPIEALYDFLSGVGEKRVLNEFRYIDGKNFFGSILGCLILYMSCMRALTDNLKEVLIVIDIEEVRKNVLYFENEYFKESTKKNGLVFSDKDSYRLNESFSYSVVEDYNPIWYFVHLFKIFNAFGYSSRDGFQFVTGTSLQGTV